MVKDDRIVRIEPEDAKDDSVFGEHQIRPCLRGVPVAGEFTALIGLNTR
jgi:hypothetical protein